MVQPLRSLRVHTAELRRQPGLRRRVEQQVSASELGIDDPRTGDDLVDVDLVAESTIDGIVVSGQLRVSWVDECRRCLVPTDQVIQVEADELYQHDVSDPEAFEIGPDALDLTPLVRDGALLALADPPPLCRSECAGLCPVCGADRNLDPCRCDVAVRDERWAALDDLRLDE